MKRIIPFIVLTMIFCASNIEWGKDNWKNIIKVDGKGYYAYLPAIFIYHDLNFSFFDSIEKKYSSPKYLYDYRVVYNEKFANKYFAGTAIAEAPFFGAAHVGSLLFGYPADGYSKLYCIAINIAAIFYLWIGLLFLKKLLIRYGTSHNLAAFILIATVFATNIFYYVICEPAMSHIYSFAFITMLMYHLHLYFSSPQSRSIIIIAALLAMITLIRPVNMIIILMAPFLAGNKNSFVSGISYMKRSMSSVISGILLFLLIISIQLIIYKIQTGSFWIDSYGDEKFKWDNFQSINFLFSYKKGLFIYTPLSFIAMLGLYRLYKTNKFQFLSLLAFLLLLVYVLSSWWNWWYGGSFSSRACMEYLGIIALLIYFSYDLLKPKRSRIIYSVLIIGCIVLCQIQTYQYRYYMIHWDKMDKEHYWNVFLHLDKTFNPNADLLQ